MCRRATGGGLCRAPVRIPRRAVLDTPGKAPLDTSAQSVDAQSVDAQSMGREATRGVR